jgi:hypothetical protein
MVQISPESLRPFCAAALNCKDPVLRNSSVVLVIAKDPQIHELRSDHSDQLFNKSTGGHSGDLTLAECASKVIEDVQVLILYLLEASLTEATPAVVKMQCSKASAPCSPLGPLQQVLHHDK